MIRQSGLAGDPVSHGNDREVRPIGFPGFRVVGVGAGAAVAATEIVQADHEKPIGINGLAGADTAVPPARLAVVQRVVASGMVMAAECVADQYRIAGIGVEFAIGFHHQIVAFQRLAAGQLQRLVEVDGLRAYKAHGIRGQGIRHGCDEFLVRSTGVWPQALAGTGTGASTAV